MKKKIIYFGLFLISLGFASLTEEILGCFTLPVDGFLYFFGTTSHKAFVVMLEMSHYLIMTGVFISLGAVLMFPSIERTKYIGKIRFQKWKKWKKTRVTIQGIILTLITIHVALTNFEITNIPSICPLSFAEQAASGIYGLSAMFFLAVFATVLIFGRALCSWICVYGPVQEHSAGLLSACGTDPNKNKFMGKWPIYSLTAVFWGSLFFSAYIHYDTLDFKLSNGYILAETWVFIGGLVTFIPLTLLMTKIFGNRYFCKYLCPIGGTTALYSKFGLFRVRIQKEICDDCKKCEKTCPMSVDIHSKYVSTDAPYVKDNNCIACGECVDACKTGTLSLGFGSKK
ncbi:MAG: 4Fe-4S binding protein [Sedimenticola sp.]